MFRDFFLTQFTPTAERTQRWLTNVVLPDDTRILFLTRDATGRPVGNFGVCGIGEHCAELDNLIRGERGGDARLVFDAEVRLLAWCFTELDVTTICLHVFHTNTRTIGLHATVGFRDDRFRAGGMGFSSDRRTGRPGVGRPARRARTIAREIRNAARPAALHCDN